MLTGLKIGAKFRKKSWRKGRYATFMGTLGGVLHGIYKDRGRSFSFVNSNDWEEIGG